MERRRDFTSAERLVEEVREHIFKFKGTYQHLADKVGVNHSTINNIASGKTRWPRPTTLFPLLEALGLSIRLIQKGK